MNIAYFRCTLRSPSFQMCSQPRRPGPRELPRTHPGVSWKPAIVARFQSHCVTYIWDSADITHQFDCAGVFPPQRCAHRWHHPGQLQLPATHDMVRGRFYHLIACQKKLRIVIGFPHLKRLCSCRIQSSKYLSGTVPSDTVGAADSMRMSWFTNMYRMSGTMPSHLGQ